MELDPQTRLLEARAKFDAARRARALREAYGINFYRPHWKQHLFHSRANVTGRYCRFGNRTGKTICGTAEDVAMCIGERAWYKKPFDILEMVKDENGDYQKTVRECHPGGDNHPLVTHGIPQYPVKGLLVCSDWDKAKELFTNRAGSYNNLGELFQMIPHEALGKPHTSRGGHIDMIPIKRTTAAGGGESLLYIDTVESFKHAWRSAESSDFDFIHYDEPPPQEMFIANKRGLTDRNGKFWINATPVEEMWINDEFAPPSRSARVVPSDGLEFRKTERGGARFIITASIFDNPYITADGIAEFEASLNREQRECRLHGLPMNLAGLIYKEFIYDFHVLADVPKGWLAYHLPPKDYTIRVAWDVHDAIPQAVLMSATAPNGEVFLFDEIFDNRLIDVTAKALKERISGRYVASALIDPRAVIESPVTGESILDELAKHELYFDRGSKDMELGISKTREVLSARTPGGFPRIWFSPTLTETLYEIMRYAYNPRTQKPVDKEDHMLENLRRLVLNGLEYQSPPSDSDYVPRKASSIRFDEDRALALNPSLK